MSEILIAAAAAALLAALAFGLLWVRPRLAERRRKRQSEEDFDRLVASGRATVQAALETATRVREEGLGSLLRDSVEQLTGVALREQPALRKLAGRDGRVAILFSDIEDSTARNEELGDRAWLRVLAAHDELVRSQVGAHNGHVIKSQGDGFMTAFGEPGEAVRCAAAIQGAIETRRRLRKARIRVRIGIHVGEAVAKDGDLFGRNVALAARVADQAAGGEVLVSSDVAEALPDDPELSFLRPREVALKGLRGKHTLLAVEPG